MFDWMKRSGKAVAGRVVPPKPAQKREGEAGEYWLLYKYLRDRYADCVVLTFVEIEDLLGFSLPDSARREGKWWSGPGSDLVAPGSAQSDAWTLASRTATVNLAARNVVFERQC